MCRITNPQYGSMTVKYENRPVVGRCKFDSYFNRPVFRFSLSWRIIRTYTVSIKLWATKINIETNSWHVKTILNPPQTLKIHWIFSMMTIKFSNFYLWLLPKHAWWPFSCSLIWVKWTDSRGQDNCWSNNWPSVSVRSNRSVEDSIVLYVCRRS